MPKNILLCPPDYFDVEYDINAWMHEHQPINKPEAKKQWLAVRSIYERLGWTVNLIPPAEHLPDMVFATDNCLMVNDKILLANFRYPERQPESAQFETWFKGRGYTKIRRAKHKFEGGDNLLMGTTILAGWGFRSDPAAAEEMSEYLNAKVISLRIVDPNFYHLDTCVAVLSDDTVAFYPDALDKPSQQRLRSAAKNVIEATLEEVRGFGLNAVSDGHTIITSNESQSLLAKYRHAGFEVIGTPILEFRKSGGGVKCLTLSLN